MGAFRTSGSAFFIFRPLLLQLLKKYSVRILSSRSITIRLELQNFSAIILYKHKAAIHPPLHKSDNIEIVIDSHIHDAYIICMHNFSKHSLDRLDERKFSKESIESILNNEVDVVIYPSTRDEDIDLYFGKESGKYILVVYNRKTFTVITVRNMRKNEKIIFNEVLRHEKE